MTTQDLGRLKFLADGLFVTSDNHFGHANVIKHCNRPFLDVQEMNWDLVRRWNEKVPKSGTVLILGDFFFKCPKHEAVRIINSLNGIKFLLPGNHDQGANHWVEHSDRLHLLPDSTPMRKGVFHTVDIQVLYDNGESDHVVLCHFPIYSWNRRYHGSIHLHGHTHGTCELSLPNMLDVGIDTTEDLAPLSWSEILEKLQ